MLIALASTTSGVAARRAAGWQAERTVTGPVDIWTNDSFATRVDAADDESILAVASLVGAGRVRLESDASGCNHATDRSQSGIALASVLGLHAALGLGAFDKLNGEFGVVIWDDSARELIAVRDPLGLAPLYYQERNLEIAISSSLDGFEAKGDYDREFIARFVTSRGNCVERTIWSTIRPVPAGTALVWRDGRTHLHRYWSVDRVRMIENITLEEAGREFKRLLNRSVLAHISPQGQTWSHLSGGLDSSSVVSVAATLADSGDTRNRLGGTISWVDSLGNADETVYVDAVTRRFGLRNERIVDDWPWRDDGHPPPLTQEPSRDYPFYARDRLTARIIRDAGGRSLLSGVGPDDYLPQTAAHVADLVWRRRAREAIRELYGWTVNTRGSLWQTVFEHVCVPLLTPSFQGCAHVRSSQVPQWFTRRFATEFTLRQLLASQRSNGKRRGFCYEALVARQLSFVAASLGSWLHLPGIELRHPFLHLPLVEFAVSLPYTLRTDSYWSKPVLRAALRSTLPEEVRLRSTKAILTPRICWAFRNERALLSRLLEAPILADLGCVEPRKLMAAVDSVETLSGSDAGFLFTILSLETWLSVKSGRSTVGGNRRIDKEQIYAEAHH
ncbi:MAG: asparagine synthase-related protein [Vicinamibacterales bacterium]